jgi:uncharacterized protein YbjQ (UPF0145 family)
MKNYKKVLGMLSMVLVFGIMSVSCSSAPKPTTTDARQGWSYDVHVPGKDFTSLGIVIATAESGKEASSTDLATEAKNLGADDIINVRIYTERNSSGKIVLSSASATAIKYTGDPLAYDVVSAAGGASGAGGAPIGGLFGGLALGGTAVSEDARQGWSYDVNIPAKDFTSLGIVTATAGSGKKVSSTDLASEAKKLGADDIINVRIYTDKNSSGKIISSTGSATAIKYKGSALIGEFFSATALTSEDDGAAPGTPPAKKKFLGLF